MSVRAASQAAQDTIDYIDECLTARCHRCGTMSHASWSGAFSMWLCSSCVGGKSDTEIFQTTRMNSVPLPPWVCPVHGEACRDSANYACNPYFSVEEMFYEHS